MTSQDIGNEVVQQVISASTTEIKSQRAVEKSVKLMLMREKTDTEGQLYSVIKFKGAALNP